jgi:hypothetical protein
MTTVIKIGGVVLAVGLLMAMGVYALFHGYFDHGLFEVKRLEWSGSPPRRAAIVAERSDHEAMSSDQYFVLIADHVPSASELRSAYYSRDVVFRAGGDDCLSVRWNDSNALTITCTMKNPDPLYTPGIAVQKYKAGDVAIRYVNIADSGKRW